MKMQMSIIAIEVSKEKTVVLKLEHQRNEDAILEALRVIQILEEEVNMDTIINYFVKSKQQYSFLNNSTCLKVEDINTKEFDNLFLWTKQMDWTHKSFK